MQIEAYGPKSFAVYGHTAPYGDILRSLDGKPNSNLRGRPGWIFKNIEYPRVEAFVAQANAGAIAPARTHYATIPAPPSSPSIIVPRPTFSPRTSGPLFSATIPTSPRTIPASPRIIPTSSRPISTATLKFPSTPLQLFQYGADIAVLGDTEPFRQSLKDIGGRYNSDIEGNKGWTFKIGKYEQINDLITRINAGQVAGLEPKYNKTPTAPMQMFQYGADLAVLGDTKPFRKQLKALGGKFSYDISGQPGWTFNLGQYPAVNELVTASNTKYFP